jgi:ABC-type sugar transport system ATPase subunit
VRLTAPDSPGLKGVVEFTEQLGDATIVYVRTPWQPELIIAKLGQEHSTHRMGDTVGLQLDHAQILLFDSHGLRVDKA